MLHDGGVDFRDCYEKADLVKRLRETDKQLPPSVRARLYSLRDRFEGDTDPERSPVVRVHEPPMQHLFNDEQYVVKVFNVRHPVLLSYVPFLNLQC